MTILRITCTLCEMWSAHQAPLLRRFSPGPPSISPPFEEAVERLATKVLLTMPECVKKTIESVRKHKLTHWDHDRESNLEAILPKSRRQEEV